MKCRRFSKLNWTKKFYIYYYYYLNKFQLFFKLDLVLSQTRNLLDQTRAKVLGWSLHFNIICGILDAKSIVYVRTYVIHLLGTYVTIWYNWLIFWQNALYLYLGRTMMCLILQETLFQDQELKPCKSDQDSSLKSICH